MALPHEESHRAEIVAAFATPRDEKGVRRLPHPPEALKRFIDAAGLAPDARDEWIRTVESAAGE